MKNSRKTLAGILLICMHCGLVFGEDTIPFSLTFAHPLSTAPTDEGVVVFNAALINARINELQGASVAGITTRVTGPMMGYQASLIANITESEAAGVQVGGIVNSARSGFRGVQSAWLVNSAKDNMMGIQAGFINVAEQMKGVQIGFINVADNLDGIPLGIINVAGNGKQSAIAYATNFSGVNVGAKFIVNRIHSVISFGSVDIGSDYDIPLAYSTFWGFHQPLGPVFLEVDFGTMFLADLQDLEQVDDLDKDKEWEDYDFHAKRLNAVRFGFGWNITDWISVFGGVGPGFQVTNEDWKDPEYQTLYYAGITLF